VSHYRVLIPTTNPSRTGPLLKAVSPFLNAEDSRGTLLGVIEMAPERPLSEGVEVARAYRALLSRITRYAERGPGELRGQVRIAHVAAQGIREAVLETDTNLLVLEAASQTPRQDGLWVNAVEDLLVDPPCDVALVRPDTAPIRSVLVPVRGGPSAQLALRLAATVCKETGPSSACSTSSTREFPPSRKNARSRLSSSSRARSMSRSGGSPCCRLPCARRSFARRRSTRWSSWAQPSA